MKKKLLLLGGLFYLKPVIDAAHKLGVHVITCDYIPDNIAHRYSDEYHNVSVIDKEAVLKLARELQIDGIMSFAVDPGVTTAAYVAEKMGLPFAGSYESVKILQNKDLFRDFLTRNGFNVPVSGGYNNLEDALSDLSRFTFPLIVKPTDSAGSKGVTRIDTKDELEYAFNHAIDNSISGRVIIEEFIEKRGCSSDCDSFSVNGVMTLTTFNSQHFDKDAANPYTPSAFSWPSDFSKDEETYLATEIQRLVSLLGLKTSIYNIETRVGINGKPYIMEMSPRGGGNRLAELEAMMSGNDMITAAVQGALGLEITPFKERKINGYWAEAVIHSDNDQDAVFEGITVKDEYRPYVVRQDLYKTEGDIIKPFDGANEAIGTLFLHFPDRRLLDKALNSLSELVTIKFTS